VCNATSVGFRHSPNRLSIAVCADAHGCHHGGGRFAVVWAKSSLVRIAETVKSGPAEEAITI
jgi:hypothetical protein